MSDLMSLLLPLGIVVVILLQVALLWRSAQRPDALNEVRLQAWQENLAHSLARLERELREELARGRREDAEEAFRDREERAQSATLLGQAVSTQMGQLGTSQAERLEGFARELSRFSLALDERFERLKNSVDGRLTAIQLDNAKKLDEIRRTVDEKLHATLEQRLGESFRLVSERLEQVQRGLGELQHFGAEAGGAVGDGQADQVGLAGVGEFGVDFDAGVDLLLLVVDDLDQVGRGFDLREQGELAVFDGAGFDGGDVTVSTEGAVGEDAAEVLEPDAGRVGDRVIGRDDVLDPLAFDGAAVAGVAFGEDAEKLALVRHCSVSVLVDGGESRGCLTKPSSGTVRARQSTYGCKPRRYS